MDPQRRQHRLHRIEKVKGHYDFSQSDPWFAALKANGFSTIAILGANSNWYDGNVPPYDDEGRAAYARYAAALAARYADHDVWLELVNEPNTSGGSKDYWNGTLYAELAAVAGPAVHAAAANASTNPAGPSLEFVGPASGNIGLATGFLRAIFEGGALRQFDRVTVHPYRSDGPETAWPDLGAVADLVAEYAPPWRTPIPVVSGEWGYGAARRDWARLCRTLFQTERAALHSYGRILIPAQCSAIS